MNEPATEKPATAGTPAPARKRKTAKRPILRRLLSSVLVFEAIILILAIPVAIKIEDLHHGVAFSVGGGLALVAVLLAGFIGRGRWALVVGAVLQFAIIAAGVEIPALYVLGVVFCALWFGGIYMAGRLEQPQPR